MVAPIVPALVALRAPGGLLTGTLARPLLACAACYGDPNSPLTKGELAGVLILLGFIVSLLVGVMFLIRFWAKRARVYESQRLAAVSVGRALVWLAAEPGTVPFAPTGDEVTPEPRATRMVHDSWFGDSP